MPITQQTIAIIGCDNAIPGAITGRIGKGNYRYLLSDKCREKAGEALQKLNLTGSEIIAEVYDCQHEASWEADIIFIAVPLSELEIISEKIGSVVTQKELYVITERIGRDLLEKVENLFPHSKVALLSMSDPESEANHHEY